MLHEAPILELLDYLERLDVVPLLFDLERAGMSELSIAKRLQVNASTVCRWKSREMKPRYMQRVTIVRLHAEIATAQRL